MKLYENCFQLAWNYCLRSDANSTDYTLKNNCVLISSFFGTEHCDSGLQQMGLTLAENRVYKL